MPSNSERTLVTNDNNPGSVGTQTENSSSKNSLEQEIESLGKEIKSLRKQNRLNSGIIGLGVIGFIGYIVANNWLAIAPVLATLGTAIAAAAPVIGIVVGAIIGAAVLVGASYAAWRYRAQIKEGFKYAAEKTVDGAKYTAGKVKDASVYTAEKAREGYHSVKGAVSSVGKAAKKGTGTVLGEMGRSLSNLSESMSSLDEIPDLMGPQKSQGKAVLLAKRELDPDLTNNGRDSGNPSLRSSSSSRSSSTDSIRTDSTISSKAELLNPAEHKEVKAPSSFREKMPSWLRGKKAPKETTNVKYQVLSESGTLSVAPPKPPRSNSLNSIGTESTATVSDSDSQNFATVRRSNSSSSLNASPKLTPFAPPKPPARSVSLLNLNELNASSQNSLSEKFGSNPIRVDNEVWYDAVTTLPDKGTLTHSNSTDSGRGSSDPLIPEKPRTYKSEVHISLQQPEVTASK